MLPLVFYVFIDVIAFSSVIIAVLPFHVMFLGAGPLVVTLYMSTFSFVQFFASPYIGRLSDKFGRKPMLITSCIADLFSHSIMAIASSLNLVLLSRVIAGLFSCNISVGTAYISDITSSKDRTKYIGYYNAAFSLGFVIGPIVGGLLAGSDPSNPNYLRANLFAASMNFINLFILFFFLKSSKNLIPSYKKTKKFISEIFSIITNKNVSYLFYLYFLVNFVFSGLNGIFALWSKEIFNWGPQQIGFLMCFVGILLAVHQSLSINIFVNKYREKKTVFIGIASIFVGVLFLSFTKNYIILSFAIFFLTLGIGIFNPTINSLISKNIEKSNTGAALSINQSAMSISRFSGQPFAGLFFQSFGYSAPLFVGIAILGIIKVVFGSELLNKD